jgi:large subunit ribosomal protein L1
MTHGKRYRASVQKLDRAKTARIEDAVKLVKEMASCKFDETVDVALRLGVDPKQADQNIRGTVVLPHGTGRKVRVLVLAKGEKEREAQQAGADLVGSDDYMEKIQGGWLEFDAIIATPDLMAQVGRLGKILGPRGLMPNPKSGTVTFDVAKAVRDAKAGKIEFRVDKAGNLHAPVGKASFSEQQLAENARVLFTELMRLKPASLKGTYVRGASMSSTMGPGVRLDVQEIMAFAK